MLFIHRLSRVVACPMLTLLWPHASWNRLQSPLTLHQTSGDKQQLDGSSQTFVIDIVRQSNTVHFILSCDINACLPIPVSWEKQHLPKTKCLSCMSGREIRSHLPQTSPLWMPLV